MYSVSIRKAIAAKRTLNPLEVLVTLLQERSIHLRTHARIKQLSVRGWLVCRVWNKETQWKVGNEWANIVSLFSHPSLHCLYLLVWVDRPIPQIPLCTCSISHNTPFRTVMYTLLFWIMHFGIRDKCVLAFVRLVYCKCYADGLKIFSSFASSNPLYPSVTAV